MPQMSFMFWLVLMLCFISFYISVSVLVYFMWSGPFCEKSYLVSDSLILKF